MARTKGYVTCSVATAALMLAVWLVPVSAKAEGFRHGRGGWGAGLMLGVPLHSMNLTPDQQAQVRSILSTYRASARPIIQQLRQTQSDLGDKLLGPGEMQTTDLQGQLQQISDLRTKLLQLSAQATVDVRNLLKPDQLTAAAQTKAKLKDLRSQMRQLIGPGAQP